VPQRYLPSGKNSDNTISSLSWAPWRHFRPTINCRLENVDIQRGKICWRFGSRTLNRYRSLTSISLVSVSTCGPAVQHNFEHCKLYAIYSEWLLFNAKETIFSYIMAKKKLPFDEMVMVSIYRLMHALFHIKTVIIPRDRYRPEAFSPRVDISRGMITVLIWKKTCINLFITYFNIELKEQN
jgi:hypothetical protein